LRESLVGVVVIVCRQRDLFQVVSTLRSSGSFASGLHRRQQERNQDGNDGDDNQELD